MTPSQKAAILELSQKTLTQIQTETAMTWAYRAWAARQVGLDNDYVSYADEAIEHGALAGDDVLAAVRRILAE